MAILKMEDFVQSFRKQFIFQKKKINGVSERKYYTAYNSERNLKTDTWAIIVFIRLAPRYGFTPEQIRNELNIKHSLYEVLSNEIPELLSPVCDDKNLRETILVKSGLVRNHILATFKVRPEV